MNSFNSADVHMGGGNDTNDDPARCGIAGYINLLGEGGLTPAIVTGTPGEVTCPDCARLLAVTR